MEISAGQMCDDLLLLLGRIKAAMFDIAEQHGLTPVQVGALYAILHGHDTMGDLASNLHCDASNVTGIVDRLVTQKLVLRQKSAQDRRTKMLTLTAAGRKVIDEIIARLPQAIGCQCLTNMERSVMHAAIAKLASR